MKRALPLLFLANAALSGRAQQILEVHPIGINPAGEDYAPVVLDSGFVMCSVRDNAALIGFVDAESGKSLSDLYFVPFAHSKAGAPVLFSQNLCTPVNEGPASFADQGRTICYTRNQVLPKKLSNMRAANGQLGLFFSQIEAGAWSLPVPFQYNEPKSSNMHPAFSADGLTLVFASDRPGGYGGMDLYRSERTPSGWNAPENLGPSVNSAHDEVYPRIQHNGTLHFSSNRAGGLGGLDIYFVRPMSSGWSMPEAMPAPVNSTKNDHGYHEFPGGYQALMGSDRNGADAIFQVRRTVPKFTDCNAQKPNNYCYALRKRPHAATSSLPLDHYWDMGDGTRIKGYQAQHCYKKPGAYQVRSLLVDRKSGDIFHDLGTQQIQVFDKAQAWVAVQDTVRTGRRVELHSALSHLPGLNPIEYQWDLGDGSRNEGARVVHAFKQAGVYEVKLHVIGTPDAQGEIPNQCNSRTVVVVDRFKDHEDATVVAEYQDAFGKTHSFEYQELPFDEALLTGDDNADVLFSVQLFASKERIDLDDARFVQVRKFYRVIERFDPITSTYTYSVGETKTAEELYQVFKKVKELQFLDAEVFSLREEKLIDLSQLDLTRLEDLNHRKLRTSAIHFAYKSAAIEESSHEVLDQVVGLMRQHPELHLVIEAHTDDIGGHRYNYDLSQSRALSVLDYLVEEGVLTGRLVPIGHGKNQPIASNKTEEGRAMNRRVEFRMIVPGSQPMPVDAISGASRRPAGKR
ncbi:MAG: PKD domain-containing protein [Flavobacteriales bacterium]